MKIRRLKVTNFRSLIDFEVNEFDSTTIFYGENNAGKSNILKILELIFKRKVLFAGDSFTSPINFYEGILLDFSNNFFNNDKDLKIKFIVEVETTKNSVHFYDVIKKLSDSLPDELIFSIEGEITSSQYGGEIAEIQTKRILINQTTIFSNGKDGIEFFPSIKQEEHITKGDLNRAFTGLIDFLNDCVYLISSERESQKTKFENELVPSFNPEDLKRSLYSLYLLEEKHCEFEEIDKIFSQEPFGFGNLSFSKHNGELEIMVKKDGIRLPLKHLGSGAEQILFIISSIICSRSKILGIEELEQNLSPKLQKLALFKIQSMIGSKIDQILLSSHSSVFAKTQYSNNIYLIDRKELKTYIQDQLNKKYSKKIKEHFIDTAFPHKTYTKKELDDNFEEIRRIAEERFKM
jgi:predicted ATP-dependent endonuclease of OLD family